MLCPEVWDFKPPQHCFLTEEFNCKKGVPSVIKTHYFNHSVSVVLPDTSAVPESLQSCLLEDSDYYQINGLPVFELLNKEFIEAFVKEGEITLLAIGNKIDLHNSIAITPTGFLVLSLILEDFQKLGLEGKVSFFDRKVHTRYVVTIDLKSSSFTPGKKNYEKTRTSLTKNFNQKFDVIVAWHPPRESTCPSSVAAWFHDRGYDVSLCHQKFSRRMEYSQKVPIITEECDKDKFFEWLGVFSISGDLDKKENEYVNTYKCPSPHLETGQVQYLQWSGFLTRKQIECIYNTLKDYLAQRSMSLWCSLNVQGFADSPVSWNLKEHNFFMDGDNSYTVLFQSDSKCVIRKSLSSNNKPRIS